MTIFNGKRYAGALYPSLHLLVPLERSTIVPLLLWMPTWKTMLIRALLRDNDGDFVDVGANIGQTLLDYVHSGLRRRYWAIEPNPHCVRIVRDIVEHNNLTGCEVLEVGLFDVETAMRLLVLPGLDTDTRATVLPSLWPARASKGRGSEVSLIPFDALRRRHGIGRVGLIKIDVEGAELEALVGMEQTLLHDRPPVICEVLLRYRSADAQEYRERTSSLASFLRRLDYDIYRIGKGSPRPLLKAGPLEEFPIRTWNQFRRTQCDYLLLPRETARNVVSRLRFA